MQRGGRGSASCKVAPHVRHLKAPTTHAEIVLFLRGALINTRHDNDLLGTFHFSRKLVKKSTCIALSIGVYVGGIIMYIVVIAVTVVFLIIFILHIKFGLKPNKIK